MLKNAFGILFCAVGLVVGWQLGEAVLAREDRLQEGLAQKPERVKRLIGDPLTAGPVRRAGDCSCKGIYCDCAPGVRSCGCVEILAAREKAEERVEQLPAPVAVEDDAKAVTTRHVGIVDEKGRRVAALSYADGGAGLWLQMAEGEKDGPMVAIFTIDKQAAIGLYESRKPKGGGMPLALTLDKDSRPLIQVRDVKGNGKAQWIDLLKLAEWQAAQK
jgi:hypothetical protein